MDIFMFLFICVNPRVNRVINIHFCQYIQLHPINSSKRNLFHFYTKKSIITIFVCPARDNLFFNVVQGSKKVGQPWLYK